MIKFLVAWDMITRNGTRRTYTHYFDNLNEAETLYQKKAETRSTIEIWLIKSEYTQRGAIHEYIHAPHYVR